MNESALKERLKAIATEKETTLNKVWIKLKNLNLRDM